LKSAAELFGLMDSEAPGVEGYGGLSLAN
jgi:hypothetical protein